MSEINFKDFLTSGAFLQKGLDSFKVLIGPFTLTTMDEIQASSSSTFIYKAEFWDFLRPEGKASQNLVYKAQKAFDLNREEIIGLLESEMPETPHLGWQPADEKGFKDQFAWSQNLFEKGQVKKTVPVIIQRSENKIGSSGIAAMLLNLICKKNFGWTYAFFENGNGMLGHTPEMLLEWDLTSSRAHTVALAGTVSNEPGAKMQIIEDPKIRVEHNYVIDDINAKLSDYSFVREETDVLELKHLLHLRTRYEVPMENIKSFLNCVSTLHPTAAMGVYPNNLNVLKEMAQFDLQKDRGPFAGPFGVIDGAKALVVVPIRGIAFDKSGSQIFSGCGVTAESQYESELLELENKRNSVKKMLGLMHD